MAQTTSNIQASPNVVWHQAIIQRKDREQVNQHPSKVLWFTGLSGSGKSTLAHALEQQLFQRGFKTFVLDGDNVRHGLCADLGFSEQARVENIRRVSEVAKLFLEAGVLVLTAFISPFSNDRNRARELVGNVDFYEIYCQCAIEECENRDVKGLYKRARAGEIPSFTGISSPYEAPEKADLILQTDKYSIEECVEQLLTFLQEKEVIQKVIIE